MSDLYWINGSGNNLWADAQNWSLQSGGAGGAGVPDENDNIIFKTRSTMDTVIFEEDKIQYASIFIEEI